MVETKYTYWVAVTNIFTFSICKTLDDTPQLGPYAIKFNSLKEAKAYVKAKFTIDRDYGTQAITDLNNMDDSEIDVES